MQFQTHLDKIFQSLLKYIAPDQVVLSPLETEDCLMSRLKMRDARFGFDGGKPGVPG